MIVQKQIAIMLLDMDVFKHDTTQNKIIFIILTFHLSSSQPTFSIYLRDKSNLQNHIWIIFYKV